MSWPAGLKPCAYELSRQTGELCVDEFDELRWRPVGEHAAVRIIEAGNHSRDRVAAGGVVQQEDALAALRRAREHVTDLESDAEARSGGIRDQDVARGEPVDVARVHRRLGERRLARLDVVLEQVPREHVVPERLQPRAGLFERPNRGAVAAHRAREIDLHDEIRMNIHIRRLDASVPLPSYQTADAAGFDLAASEDITVPAHQIRLVPTGLVIEVPKGYFLGVFARSSTPLKRGLIVANGVGVVDPDYSGPEDQVFVQVLNVTDREVTIRRGDRIAQGIVLAAARVTFEEGNTRSVSRGGFGSTGT